MWLKIGLSLRYTIMALNVRPVNSVVGWLSWMMSDHPVKSVLWPPPLDLSLTVVEIESFLS